MAESLPLPLALTMGDPAGIGPEITAKAWRALHIEPEFAFFVIGDPKLYPDAMIIEQASQASDYFSQALPVLPIDCPEVSIGKPNENAGAAITGSIKRAVELCINRHAAAIITNPISKDVLYRSGFKFPGHTEYLAELTKTNPAPYANGPVMMLSAAGLRVALTSIHIPLADVPKSISQQTIIDAATVLHGALKHDFGIQEPRIAMAGLNPHAGENGALGREEIEILNPAAAVLRGKGINITDAQSADTLFHEEARQGYDAVLAMYHDQGLIPVKTLDFHGGINTTLGLPIIRTSPDHGTAFAIAGKGVARADSLINAVRSARELSDQRMGAR
jgi:4-hydroxythreonine-4-phosphate dehydrogenase